MKIEEAIQQKKPFRSAWHRAVVNLIYTSNWLKDQIKEKLKPHGITMQQYNVLRVLRGAGEPISTSVIRDRLLDKMADTSRLVERLHQKGLVEKRECPHDKRLVDVSLTDKGRAILGQMDASAKELDNIIGGLNEEEACTVSHLLDKMRE